MKSMPMVEWKVYVLAHGELGIENTCAAGTTDPPISLQHPAPRTMVRFKNCWLLVEFLPASQLPTPTPTAALIAKDPLTALRTSTLTHFGDTS
ncbi:hypothetical protein BC834DRAFT_972925 [Gloeopeniophorella convolvens]|nr:hypothetical protein BC834DRAFT_972925 [Gloeopeniophorella convolvens]